MTESELEIVPDDPPSDYPGNAPLEEQRRWWCFEACFFGGKELAKVIEEADQLRQYIESGTLPKAGRKLTVVEK